MGKISTPGLTLNALKKTFELTELAEKLCIAEDKRKTPHLADDVLKKRYHHRMVYLKDLKSRKNA